MKMKKFAVSSMLAVAALGIGAGTSHAQPAAPAPEKINWDSKVVDKSVVTTIDAGAFKVSGDGKNIELQDGTGHAVVSLPLSWQLNALQFPMDQKVSEDGKTVTLTPVFDLGKAKPIAGNLVAQPINGAGLAVKDIASPDENLKAQQTFSSQLAIATASGGLIGTIVGAVVGTFIMPAIGTITGAGIGGIVGTIAVGGPTLVAAGIGLGQTLLAEPGTTVYAKK
ncbi:ammonium transporter [Rhodococcus sp. NPDC127528]|uniref:ammonium transporter n=1 Tax=unclassified Rhodococcus (in: high G+C Gram-positive bacteria) TaxID=192944 RepID=UPI00363871ED